MIIAVAVVLAGVVIAAALLLSRKNDPLSAICQNWTRDAIAAWHHTNGVRGRISTDKSDEEALAQFRRQGFYPDRQAVDNDPTDNTLPLVSSQRVADRLVSAAVGPLGRPCIQLEVAVSFANLPLNNGCLKANGWSSSPRFGLVLTVGA